MKLSTKWMIRILLILAIVGATGTFVTVNRAELAKVSQDVRTTEETETKAKATETKETENQDIEVEDTQAEATEAEKVVAKTDTVKTSVAQATVSNDTAVATATETVIKTDAATVNQTATVRLSNPMFVEAQQAGSISYDPAAQDQKFSSALFAFGDVSYVITSQKDVAGGKVEYFTIPVQKESVIHVDAAVPAGVYEITIQVSSTGNEIILPGVREFTYTLTVEKAAPVVTAPVAQTLTYTGEQQALIRAGSTSAGTLQYKLGADGTYGTDIPQAVDAQDEAPYVVYYRVVGDANYKDVEEQSLKVTIHKADPNVTAPKTRELTYNGQAQSLIEAGVTTGGELQYKLGIFGTYSADLPTATDAQYEKAYRVYYRVAGDTNYNSVAEQTLEVTISRATPVITAPTAQALTYTGAAQILVEAGSTTGGTLVYQIKDVTRWGQDLPTATDAGAYTVEYEVQGDRNYMDVAAQQVDVTISAKSIVDASVTVDAIADITYDGQAHQPVLTIRDNDRTLTLDKDYTVTYPADAKNIGSYEIQVTGRGNYSGTTDKTFVIQAREITEQGISITADQDSYTYNGAPQQPILTLLDGSTTLKEGTDYQLEYPTDVTSAGSHVIKVTGLGNYTGTTEHTYTIAPKDITAGGITIDDISALTYNGADQQPVLVVKDGDNALALDTDYTVTYPARTAAIGTHTITIAGAGNYTGTATKEFSVVAKSITSQDITITIPNAANDSFTYDGSEKKPTLIIQDGTRTLSLGTDYSVSYPQTATAVGDYSITIVGTGNYNGTVTKQYKVVAKNIHDITVTIDPVSYTYDGTAHQPTLTVKDGETALTPDNDYTVTWPSDETSAGSCEVVVTGQGNYTGTETRTYTITKIDAALTTGPAAKSLTYSGAEQELVTGGTTTGGILKYSLNVGGEYLESIPKAIKAGFYTIFYKVFGDPNHNDTAISSVYVTIGKADPVVTAPTAKDRTYDGTEQALVTAGSTTAGTLQYSTSTEDSSYSTIIPTAIHAGTYTVYYRVKGDENYNDVAAQSVQVTIATAALNVDYSKMPSGIESVYNGFAQSLLTCPGEIAGATLVYSVNGGDYSTEVPTATDAGTYKVIIAISNKSDFQSGGVRFEYKATIAKKTPTATDFVNDPYTGEVTLKSGLTGLGHVVYEYCYQDASGNYIPVTWDKVMAQKRLYYVGIESISEGDNFTAVGDNVIGYNGYRWTYDRQRE